MRIEAWLDTLAADAIEATLGVATPAVLRPTPDPKHGDYQVNGVLPLAKREKKNPRELAASVADTLSSRNGIASAEVAGPGFINLRLDERWIAARLDTMWSDQEREGVDPVKSARRIVVDFSSPNIAKQMHVGHLRSTILGAAIVELLRFVGHDVIGDNHLGDWGTQFGMLIVGMSEWGDDAALEADPIVELERVYKLASARAKGEEAFAERARRELAKLQAGDPENRARWERFVAATRASLDAIYERLAVRFDEWLGESAYHDMLERVVAELVDKKIAREDDGAVVVWFSELDGAEGKLATQKVPFIIKKRDGAFLYSTSDIATVLYRREHFATERALYVVDKRQSGHFRQLFEVVRQLGIDMELEHVGFGMVQDAQGKAIKTRDGKTVTLGSLLDEAEERAEAKMIEELSLEPEMAHRLAATVGIGAVKYADLCQNRMSDYKFSWDKLIAFKGNAGPLLQYTHARCCSLLRKSETIDEVRIVLEDPLELTLARRLIRLPDVVHLAAESYCPHHITDHLYALSRELGAFWTGCPVLKSAPPIRESRIALVDLTRRQLKLGLRLLGIDAPERM